MPERIACDVRSHISNIEARDLWNGQDVNAVVVMEDGFSSCLLKNKPELIFLNAYGSVASPSVQYEAKYGLPGVS